MIGRAGWQAVTSPRVGARRAYAPTMSTALVRALAAAALLSLVLGFLLSGRVAGGGSSAPAAARGYQREGLLSLPVGARGAVSAALGAGAPAYAVSGTGGSLHAVNRAQHLSATFASSGVSIRSGGGALGLSLRGVGYGTSLAPLGQTSPRAHANRVLYARGDVSEWYANGPLGLEQGFTVAHAPARPASGPLTLAMALSGNLRPVLGAKGQSVTLTRGGRTVLRYTGLVASDARGHVLHSWLQLAGGRLLLRVNSYGAHYPLRVDPYVQQGETLLPSEEISSVALSADESTLLIGDSAYNGNTGAAWVFTRSGGTWTEQAQLTGKEESGEGEFGDSVALSADGDTALIGGLADDKFKAPDGFVGAAWVFTRSSSTWAQQGKKFTGGEEVLETFGSRFGESVALSEDGNTALIGGGEDHNGRGAAWVFTRSGETWTQQGKKLTGVGETGPFGSDFGFSVALSSDGDTAVIGGWSDNDFAGAAWVFTRTGETWTQQGSKLTGGEEKGEPRFAQTLALSADGNTALMGGFSDDEYEPGKWAGAAWVFTRSGETWSQQGKKLTAEGEAEEGDFGDGVALSGEGNIAMIARSGSELVYTRSGETWSEVERLKDAGRPVALSSEGSTAVIVDEAGGVRVFGTGARAPRAPAALTGPASGVTVAAATLNATVNPNGSAVSACQFQYGTSGAYGASAPCGSLPGSGESPVAVAAAIAGLSANTTYHFRIVATNAGGTSYGGDASFTTGANAPGVITGAASALTFGSAAVNATVNPEGSVVGACQFQYGTSSAYGASVPCAALPGSGGAPVAVSAAIAGLSASATYHFRIVATNAGGTSYGGDASFTTPLAAPVLSAVGMTNKRFSVGQHSTAKSASAPVGTTFRFTLSEAARLTIAITRPRPGLMRGKACVAPTHALERAHAKRCTRAVAVDELTRASEPQGSDRVAFTGRVAGRALAVGPYSAVLQAGNAGGKSKALTVAFFVVS